MSKGAIPGLIIITLCLLAGLVTPVLAQTPESYWLAGWSSRIMLVIDHTRISAPLVDFPVLIHISSSSGKNTEDISELFSSLTSYADRKKIAVVYSRNLTQCYVDIEQWDSYNKQAWLWVRVPLVMSDEDTILYLFFDKSQPDNLEWVGDTGSIPAQKVWNNGFVMVQHLQEEAQGIPGEYRDATANQNNGTGGGGVSTSIPLRVDSKIAGGQSFDGIDDYIQIPDSDDFSVDTTGDLTISFWMSPAVLEFGNEHASYVDFLGKGEIGQQEWQFVMYDRNSKDRSQWISFYVYSPSGGLGAGGYSTGTVSPDEWIYITGKTDSIHTQIYRNGIYFSSDPWSSYNIKYSNGPAPVRIGTQGLQKSTDWWKGRIDEVRISNILLSDSWIQASYYSESDTLLTFSRIVTPSLVLEPIGDKSMIAGETLTFSVTATSQNGKALSFSVENLPEGAVFDSATGIFKWKPESQQIGNYNIRFSVTDGNLIDFEDIKIGVKEAPGLPGEKLRPVIVGLTAAGLAAIIFIIIRRRISRRHNRG